MLCFTYILLTILACRVSPADAALQAWDETDRPALHVPARPPTKQELDELQAMHLFAAGVMCEREDRLLEAMRAFEQAAKLDPTAVTIQKSLLMIYIAVERHEDAAKLLKVVLELDSTDPEMSYLYARLLRNHDKIEEARDVLLKGLKSPTLRDRPELHVQMEYDLGVFQESLEQYEDAAASFSRAAAVLDRPDNLLEIRLGEEEIQMRSAEAHERAGKDYLEVRQFEKALSAFQAAQAKFPPGAGRIYYCLAQLQLRQGNLKEAADSLSSYLQMLPQGTDAYELMVGIMLKQKRDAEIVPWLEQASDRDTFNIGLRLLLARQCVRAGEVAKAEKIYRDMVETAPTEEVCRELFLLLKDHHPQGAAAVAEMISATMQMASSKDNLPATNTAPGQSRAMIAALRENPRLARDIVSGAVVLAKSKPTNVDALLIFATLADRQGMLDEAEYLYRECLKQPLPAASEPLAYGGLLRVLWKARRFEAIVEVCRSGIKQAQASNRVLLRADLARALGQLERWKEALAEVDHAVGEAGDAEGFAVRTLRIRLLSQAEWYGDAEAACRVLLEGPPDWFDGGPPGYKRPPYRLYNLPGERLEIHYLLAGIYTNTHRLPQAEAELDECLKIDANNPAVNNDLGYLLADQNKKLDEAEAMIRKAIEADRKNRQVFMPMKQADKDAFKDNACYIDSLGWVLFRRGQLQAALQELEYATTLPDGDDPVIWDHLGDVRMALGQKQHALADWRQALHFYQQGKQRKMDERYRALEQKLKTAAKGK